MGACCHTAIDLIVLTKVRSLVLEAIGVSALGVGVASVVALMCGAAAMALGTPVTAAAALAFAALPLMLTRPAVRALGPRGAIHAAFLTVAVSPIVFLCAAARWSEPLLQVEGVVDRNSAFFVKSALLLLPLGLLTSLLWWFAVGHTVRRDRFVPMLTVFAIVFAALLELATHLRTRARVEPANWALGLPEVAHVNEIGFERLSPPDEWPRRYRAVTSVAALERTCARGGECRIAFVTPDATHREEAIFGGLPEYSYYPYWHTCSNTIRADARHALFVIDDDCSRDYPARSVDNAIAFGANGKFLGAVDRALVHDSLAPPHT